MYSIIRTKKLKSFGAIARSSRHTFREQPTPNANPQKSQRNRILGAKTTDELLNTLKDTLPEKRRTDAVLCIEYMITASPEAFKRHGGNLNDLGNGYFRDALSWLHQRHGAANVLCSVVHLDESTPHLVAYVAPLTKEGKLSAREFLGGPKVLRNLQDSFHAACGAPRGLSRGIKGSKAKHDKVSAFYEALTRAGDAPKLTALDYVSKALGHETEAWSQAVTIAEANALGLTVQRRMRKSRDAQEKALRQRETDIVEAEQKLQRRDEALQEREHRAAENWLNNATLLSRLGAEKARADGMQRIIDRHVFSNHERSIEKSNLTGKDVHPSPRFAR
jgi:hypothetical protein